MGRGVRIAPLLAVAAALLAPAAALAHPLGNFTINHYAGIRVEPAGVHLDVVIDMAEIPTFQERRRLDADGDGDVSEAEAARSRAAACERLAASLALFVDGHVQALRLVAAGLSFPPGIGPTLRLVCQYEAPFGAPITTDTPIAFVDGSYAERIGWREIVAVGDRVQILAVGDEPVPSRSLSSRLTAYPEDRLEAPLDVRELAFVATPGGPALAPFVAPDAVRLDGRPGDDPIGGEAPAAPAGPAAIPGGVGGELPEVFRTESLTLPLALLSLLAAAGLGAGHALTPGHGKTLMAASLVGARGQALHAVGLGLAVSASHTLGILVLAGLVTGAQQVVAPDLVVRVAPAVAAIATLAIGSWMLASEVRRRRAAADPGGHLQRHPHPHLHDPAQPGPTITWRSLSALGLAGGIIPSTSALLILLLAIAAGRPAFGIVLVAAFGLGMAAVLISVGLATVYGRGLLGRLPSRTGAGRVAELAPLAASVVVVGLGLWLTTRALSGSTLL